MPTPFPRPTRPLLLLTMLLLLLTIGSATQATLPLGIPHTPLALAAATSFVQVETGDEHTCALTSGD